LDEATGPTRSCAPLNGIPIKLTVLVTADVPLRCMPTT
jgi:hypothetical protein